jgi:hypothetical protein
LLSNQSSKFIQLLANLLGGAQMATKKARKTTKKARKSTKKARKGTKKPRKGIEYLAETVKKPAKPRGRAKTIGETNRDRLIQAGIINSDYVFSPQDAASIEELSNQEVNVLTEVFNDLGLQFFEDNTPNGFVF